MATGTTQSKASSTSSPFDVPSVEEATQRIRTLNGKLIESSKSASLIALGKYETAVGSFAGLEKKVAAATQLDWLKTVASTHADLVTDVNASYAKAVRGLLA